MIPIHTEDKIGSDGNTYRIKIYDEGSGLTSIIEWVHIVGGKVYEEEVHRKPHPINTDMHELKENLRLAALSFNYKNH